MIDAVRILKATREQMGEIAVLFKRSFRATYPDFPELHTAEEDQVFFRDVVFPNNAVYFVEEYGTILGFIAFNQDFVDHLYLVPEAQGRGLGGQLLEVALNQSSRLKLWTFQVNSRARAFYARHGFTEILMTDGSKNEEKQPDVLMEWRRP